MAILKHLTMKQMQIIYMNY